MKEVVSHLARHSLLFPKFVSLDTKEYGIKKKIKIYEGVDLNKYYNLVFVVNQKARFVNKDVETLEDIVSIIIEKQEHNYKKKILILENDLCTKAKEKLKQLQWRVFRGSL